MTRRSLLGLSAAAPFSFAAPSKGEIVGIVPPRPGPAIVESPLSVGFETLDRRHFEPERAYEPLGRLGVKWARVQTGWSRCETRKGEYDFGWLDRIVDSIRAQGVRPWFNLTYGNKLYTPESPLSSAVGWVPIFTPEARSAWVRFVERIAERFRSRVTHWEIWNEPDIKVFWKPDEPSPEGYVELVSMSAPPIRAAIPGAIIVGGAFSAFTSGFDYIERALEAGLAAHIDRLSYHAYLPRPEAGYKTRVRALRALAQRYKPGLQLWQGESGAPAAQGGIGAMANLAWTERRQAKWLLRRILTDLDAEVEVSSYFHLVDLVGYREGADSASGEKTAIFGLLRRDYTPRPSYRAYQCLCTLFDAQTQKADFIADIEPSHPSAQISDGIYVTSFERKGAPLYVYWSPADLMRENASVQTKGAFWSGAKARLVEPVLVDPLSANVLRLEGLAEARGYLRAESLPLFDYPMIVTDRSAIA